MKAERYKSKRLSRTGYKWHGAGHSHEAEAAVVGGATACERKERGAGKAGVIVTVMRSGAAAAEAAPMAIMTCCGFLSKALSNSVPVPAKVSKTS